MAAINAPSVANLFISYWEKEAIFNNDIPQLKFYKRYIDDIVIVLAGTQDSFLEFLDNISNNHYDVSFSAIFNQQYIIF